MRVLRAGLAGFLLLIGLAPAAFAAGPLEMTTPYPAVVADPGSTAKFPVTVVTDAAERVDLSVVSQPEGWTTRLRGSGSTISAVETAPFAPSSDTSASPAPTGQNFASFSAEIDIPADVQPGQNQVVVEGRAASGTTVQLTLDVAIAPNEGGSVSLETNYPALKGPAATTFKFNLTLTNDTNQQITFGLDYDAPVDWDVTVSPSGESNAASAVVDAGDNATIAVSVKAPSDAPAGSYPVTVRATGGPAPVEKQLQIDLTGTFDLTLATSDQRLNATVAAGQATTINLVVSNTGSSDLAALKLTSSPPQNWTVTFNPETINVAANTKQNVQAIITPAANALAGDYEISLTARGSDNNANDTIQMRLTVETSPIGYLIGIVVLVAAALGLFFVFQRYGRR